MAKAQLTTKAGTLVTIEGTTDEVTKLIGLFDSADKTAKSKSPVAKQRKNSSKMKDGLAGQLGNLISERFFKKPKEFGAIKSALEQQGHYYARTTLAPQLLRSVRRRELRRLKEKKHWVYVE